MNIFTSAFILYIVVTSVTPGPSNLTMLFLGAKNGFKGTLPFMTGSMTGFFTKNLICGLLCSALADFMPKTVAFLKWIGAAYMVFLGISMALSGFKDEKEKDENTKGSILNPTESSVKSGLLLQVLNAKSWISSISTYAVYVVPRTTSAPIIILAALIYLFFAVVTACIWGLFGSAIRNWVGRNRKLFGIVCGLSLLYCAVTALM